MPPSDHYLVAGPSSKAKSRQVRPEGRRELRVTTVHQKLQIFDLLLHSDRVDGLDGHLWPVAAVNAIMTTLEDRGYLRLEVRHRIVFSCVLSRSRNCGKLSSARPKVAVLCGRVRHPSQDAVPAEYAITLREKLIEEASGLVEREHVLFLYQFARRNAPAPTRHGRWPQNGSHGHAQVA